MGTTATSCKECLGGNTKEVLSAKSSINYHYMKRRDKTREPSKFQ